VRPPQPDREVLRLTPPVIFWWVWVVFAVANVADFAIQGAQARFAIVVSAVLLTITGLAYALALRPRVIARPSGLTVVNPFRDHYVPWAAIQAVDTGDWVRVHYAPVAAAGPAAADGGPAAGASAAASSPSSANSKSISCWALYISARAKRKAARPGPAVAPGFARPASRSRRALILSGNRGSMADRLAAAGLDPGDTGKSRMPEEAKYLASLPAAKAIAVRLDTRAARERSRRAQPGTAQSGTAQPGTAQPGTEGAVTACWAWPPIAAVALPLLALLIVLLA
jgi:Bacterial PH domain